MSSQTLDSMLMCSKPENEQHQQQEKKPRPADEQALKCPRCDSPNTKFCYYNNYSLTQPRYFCKSCRRYWTKGGTLRNVPVGGGCRKNRRSSSLSSRRTTTPEYHIQVQQSDHGLMANHCSPYDHSNNNNNNSHHHLAALAAQNGGGGGANNNNISLLGGSHGSSNFDLFGGYPSGNSFLETLRGGLVQYDNNILYYGLDNAGGHGVNMSQGHEDSPHDPRMQLDHQHQEIISNPSSGSSTPRMKQEMGENNNKMLWSFPWQLNGEGNYYMNGGGSGNHELDLVKENWNSAIVGVGSTWNNNLLHSPLM